jgi:hypothetical protein
VLLSLDFQFTNAHFWYAVINSLKHEGWTSGQAQGWEGMEYFSAPSFETFLASINSKLSREMYAESCVSFPLNSPLLLS